jgi:hypothetical protein
MRTSFLRASAAASLFIFTTGCASSTTIKSSPSGAKVYLDNESVGRTPYQMSDTKIIGSSTRVKLVLNGYEPYEAVIQRNEEFQVGPCIGGAFVLVPFLWVMGYKPQHTYELTYANRSRSRRPRPHAPLESERDDGAQDPARPE